VLAADEPRQSRNRARIKWVASDPFYPRQKQKIKHSMFKRFRDIDNAFQQVRLQCLLAIFSATVVGGMAVYMGFGHAREAEDRIYVLVNGQVFEAKADAAGNSARVEAHNHLEQFHHFVFDMDPNEKQIEANMRQAFYMGDGSVKKFYDNLKESGYVAGIVSGNISQSIGIDSIRLEPGEYPYAFRWQVWATEKLIRASSVTTRSLVTAGLLRKVQRSEENSHGFMVERFEVRENREKETTVRLSEPGF
jgi:conjugative transposon TraK protein